MMPQQWNICTAFSMTFFFPDYFLGVSSHTCWTVFVCALLLSPDPSDLFQVLDGLIYFSCGRNFTVKKKKKSPYAIPRYRTTITGCVSSKVTRGWQKKKNFKHHSLWRKHSDAMFHRGYGAFRGYHAPLVLRNTFERRPKKKSNFSLFWPRLWPWFTGIYRHETTEAVFYLFIFFLISLKTLRRNCKCNTSC